MDQLIAQITQRTGISDQQAREAVATVVEYLKQQLPAPLAAQVDGLLSGQGVNTQDIAQQAQGLLGGMGGMFGKQ